MHDPDRSHLESVKWILRYIKGTIDVSLVFKKDFTGKQECIGYVDSDYIEDLNKHRSTTGYVFTLSQAPVSWRSTLQSTSHCLLLRQSIWPWQTVWRRQFGLKGCLMTWGLIRISWRLIMIAWVLFIWQRTRCIMQGRSTSTSGSTLC